MGERKKEIKLAINCTDDLYILKIMTNNHLHCTVAKYNKRRCKSYATIA